MLKKLARSLKNAARRLPVPVKKKIKKALPWLEKSAPAKKKQLPDVLSGSYTNRVDVQDTINRLLKADVVSFDIFDTLILRPFRDPKEIFSVLEIETGRPSYRSNRIRAEKEARATALEASGGKSHEVTLRDIYQMMHLIDGLDVEAGMAAEMRAERRYVRPNDYMIEVLGSVLAAGKFVAFTSDMYLSSEQIRELLTEAGITVDAPIFVSSEYGVSKRNGGLYDIVREHFAAQSPRELTYAHIGDNFTVDVRSARSRGWEAHYYKNVHSFTDPAWTRNGQLLRSSAVLGLIDVKFGNVAEASGGPLNHYALGYRYAGPMTLAFVDWIVRRARELDLDQLVFLSRDGYLPHAVYQMTGASTPSVYLPWSRAIGLTGGARTFKSEWIRQFITRASEAGYETATDLLDGLGLTIEQAVLARYLDKLNEKGVSGLERLFQEQWDDLLPQLEGRAAPIRHAVDELVVGRRVGVVDIGWAGTGILTLRSMLEGREVVGFQFGAFRHQRFAALLEDGIIENFVFGSDQNFAVRNAHAKRPLFNNTLLEVLMGAPYPSVTGIGRREDDLSISLGLDSPDEHAATRQIIAGALEFATDFIGTFAEGPALRGLSGGTVGELYLELERSRLIRAVLEKEFPGKFHGVPTIGRGKQ